MSSSKAIKPKRDDTPFGKWESMPERAPSVEREEGPLVARILAMIGLFLVVLGSLAMAAPYWQRATVIPPAAGFFFATLGAGLLLFHCFVEREFQFRRLYGFLGIAMLLSGVILRLVAFRATTENWFLLVGLPCMFVGLVICIAVARNETEAGFREIILNLVGALGGLMILFAMARGVWIRDYLAVEGVLLLMLGLLFVGTYIGMQDTASDRGYKAALGLGGVGVLGLVLGIVFSLIPANSVATLVPWENFFVPAGLILVGMSILFIAIALCVCVDWPIVVLTRRDLAAYFFSPVAYLVFMGQVIFAWGMFYFFLQNLRGRGGLFEPIIINYIVSIIPVFVMMFFVPALTMRLLSEEKRSGTLEVLLTAPVNEISVVLGKFIASWIFYMLLWVPWWCFLISLRYYGREEFDYRPILSFTVAQVFISAGFMSMGLFCSSLTNNQIIAAVFTFVGMMAHLAIFFIGDSFATPGSAITEVITYVNFVDLWIESLRGTLAPRFLVFHASVTIFFLFATVKVLEARKWS